ncbi:MAG: glucose-6-phosphate isomerase [Frankiales bacterium]|nr:glucose-6-phosphate isomerase [Frankiales bacterium]
MTAEPRPEDVAEALRSGRAPSSMVGDSSGGWVAATTVASTGEPVSTGGLTVQVVGGSLVDSCATTLARARDAGLAAALAGKDPTLWGPEATPEASSRLGWLDVVGTGRALLPEVLALRQELLAEGVDRVVLCGMGGSSLAPEVVCASAGAPLVVVDTTDPGQVRAALVELERTVVVVSSKSGGTLETDSHRRAARAAFEAAGIDPSRRVVVVTDPGSPFEQTARADGSRAVFLADPDVGGRYSALTAFGIVPAGLAGADVGALLDAAAELLATLPSDDSAALALGAVLTGGAVAGRDKLVLPPAEGLVGFGDWVEQLVAESTGKQGKGVLPVVVEALDAPGTEPAADTHLVVAGADATPLPAVGTVVTGSLGAQFLAWEYATAVLGWGLEINPFDQPNVQESKDNTGAILDARAGGDSPVRQSPSLFTEGGVEVHATGDLLAGVTDLAGALQALLDAVPERGYLAVMAYLDRHQQAGAHDLRALLARRLAHPVTFGWAPRFLHSTGQLHKGGPQTGAFLQVTGAVEQDLEIPGRPFTFGELQAAQALGDLRALDQRGRPALRLHLLDRREGLATLLRAAGTGP